MQTLYCNNCSSSANSSIINGDNPKTMPSRHCNNCSASSSASESSSIIIYDNTKSISQQQHNNYLIVGLCLGLLGIIYVMALMIYIRSQMQKQRRNSVSNQSQSDPLNRMENGNSGVSCGSSCGTISPNSVTSFSLSSQSETIIDDIDGKRSDWDAKKSKTNNAFVSSFDAFNENTKSILFDKTQKTVPQERVSKRCLYISPEFFEPELLKLPPPPAIEFLQRIRELISNARGRIRNFRYKPTLLVIPEDDYFYHDMNKDQENKCLTMICPPTPPRRVKRASTPFDTQKYVNNSTKFTPVSSNREKREDVDENNRLFDSCREKNVKNCIEEVNEELSSFENNSNSETNSKTVHNNDIKCKLYVKNENKDKLSEKQLIVSSQNKISRKELVTKLNEMKCETMKNSSELLNSNNQNNCLKIINQANHSTTINNSISGNDFINVIDDDTPLDSLKLLSAKVAKKLSETTVPELNYNCLEVSHIECNKLQHLMNDFRNSFGKLKAKNICDFSQIKSSDNWTLQSVRHKKRELNKQEEETTSDNHTSSEEYSLENKCNHILHLSSSEKNDLKSSFSASCHCNHQKCSNYLDAKYSYNISNDSIDTNCELNSFASTNGYECDIGTTDTCSTSSDEVSTTSSVKANQFNSFESVSISSDITEDSLNVNHDESESDFIHTESSKTATTNDNECSLDANDTEEDDNGIDACLIQLANAQIDCDVQSKYYLNSDNSLSATNSMTSLYQFKSCNWKHNCAHNHLRHLNEYFSDDSVSSTASKNIMSYRGTEDITCFHSHDYRSFAENDTKFDDSSPVNRKNVCSCRMIGYATHQCNTLVKDNHSISGDLCSKNSKPKNKSSKTMPTNNHSNYLSNKFSKFLTKTAKNAPKKGTYSKSYTEKTGNASRDRKQMNQKINSYIDQIIPNDNNRSEVICEHSLLRKQHSPKKKLTNGTCKKYIQQRQQINDKNSHRVINGSPIVVRKHNITKHAQNCSADDNKNKHLLSIRDNNVSPNGTIIEVIDGANHHFVTRIPV